MAGLLAGCAVDVRSEGLPVLLMFPVCSGRLAGGAELAELAGRLAAGAMAEMAAQYGLRLDCSPPGLGWYLTWPGCGSGGTSSLPTPPRATCRCTPRPGSASSGRC